MKTAFLPHPRIIAAWLLAVCIAAGCGSDPDPTRQGAFPSESERIGPVASPEEAGGENSLPAAETLSADTLSALLAAYAAFSPFESDPEHGDTLRKAIFSRLMRRETSEIFPLAESSELEVVASPDSAVFAVMLSRKTGGTYAPFETFIAYTDGGGERRFYPAGEAAAGSIHQVEEGVAVMTDFLMFCSTCVRARALLFRTDTAFDPSPVFAYSGRTFGTELRYLPEKREIYAAYEDPEPGDAMFPFEGVPERHQVWLRYMNGSFQTVLHQSRPKEEEPFDFEACGS